MSIDLETVPLGASKQKDGIHFALFSKERPTLCLFENETLYQELPLERTSSDLWQLFVKGLSPDHFYKYRVDNQFIIDPYSRTSRGQIDPLLPFDWEGDQHPQTPLSEVIIYELHVKGFGGTFKGVEEKIPYLVSLGINACELMPIFDFEEETPFNSHKNFWGYNTINFFSLMESYGTIEEFKSLVKALHKAGIEVYLDVVYNHSASAAFRLLAPDVYFMREGVHELNFSGCGNTINCNHPIVQKLILDSLRYWRTEMHVDGFRFDLAPILTRGFKGEPLAHPPLIEAICADPLLENAKLIAEPWDPGGLYQVGSFPGQKFLEWNGPYRDCIRRFLKGTDGEISSFATCILGSDDLYETPTKSINFVTCHDGFTLRDLVSYNEKHNEANGEGNRDGDSCNESWNCGVEGETLDPNIQALRERQIRNFLFTLLISQGVPMLYMGDEYGHTKGGNNNTWSQGLDLNGFDWKADSPLTDFLREMIQIRRKYLKGGVVTWHGVKLNSPDWGMQSRFIAFTKGDLYIAINTCYMELEAKLPPGKWTHLINTYETKNALQVTEERYKLPPHSAILFHRITN